MARPLAGVAAAHAMFGKPLFFASQHVRAGGSQLASEFIATFGLLAVIFSRSEKIEPERQCPNCHKVLKLYVQVCPRCGEDLYLPDPSQVRQPQA